MRCPSVAVGFVHCAVILIIMIIFLITIMCYIYSDHDRVFFVKNSVNALDINEGLEKRFYMRKKAENNFQ